MAVKIQGKYLCYSFIPNSSYTLTGNARTASFSVSDTIENNNMNVKCLSAPNPDNAVKFLMNTATKIKRVRVRMNGAPGIQAGVNHIAAKIAVEFGEVKNGAWVSAAKAFIQTPNFGEWYECNSELRPHTLGNALKSMFVNPDETIFYIDDFNLQPDYVGQGITPVLEMEIETGGLSVAENGDEF